MTMADKKRILVIEDEQSVLEAFRKALEKQYDVDVAHNGDEGIEKMQSDHPDLILVDIIMPIKHGHDFLKEKRNIDDCKDIPTFVMTNVKSEAEKEKAMQEGANEYFVKFETKLVDLQGMIGRYLHPGA